MLLLGPIRRDMKASQVSSLTYDTSEPGKVYDQLSDYSRNLLQKVRRRQLVACYSIVVHEYVFSRRMITNKNSPVRDRQMLMPAALKAFWPARKLLRRT